MKFVDHGLVKVEAVCQDANLGERAVCLGVCYELKQAGVIGRFVVAMKGEVAMKTIFSQLRNYFFDDSGFEYDFFLCHGDGALRMNAGIVTHIGQLEIYVA